MNGRLDASELLKIARETLLQALLPSLPKELRYETFMVANAMAIAQREYEQGAAAERQELLELRALGDQQAPVSAESTDAALESARRQLAEAIRAGHYDAADARQEALLSVLERITRAKLSISNPKVLGNAL
ncbi:DUF6285 domain-containing protein [Azotobacter salinestris]|uniref:DUF6285 domain-containing protein n=1 Tax=Azotobacter salinestris TaxID=69964 RepID=UPI001266D8E7|nr:DUF6285 domain-containing protein [Azotobacter salinestris]